MTDVFSVVMPENPVVDVVFLHGLGGDARETWAVGDAFWPKWLGQDVPGVAVWSVGYAASPSGWLGRAMPIQDRAVNVLAALQNAGVGERPLLFVTHSMGGLLAKQMLRHADSSPAYASFASAARGVVFLATPHVGADMAKVLTSLKTVLRTTAAGKDLARNAAHLRDLNVWYRNWAYKTGIRNLVFFEAYRTFGVQIVDASSADPGLAGADPIAIDADHFTICKPSSRSTPVYGQVQRFLTSIRNDISATARTEHPRLARRIRDWDPLLLGVHRPIQVPDAESDLPTYVERDMDKQVRALLREGVERGGRFILLVGDSSVGKTRSAFEALMAEVPNWRLLHPRNQEDVEAIAANPGRNTVVWLDEVQRMLSGGLTARAVDSLLGSDHPVLLVGTIWPGLYQLFTAPPSGDRTYDPFGNHREVLRFATVVAVNTDLSQGESARAAVAAATDARLAATLTSEYGVIRALAAVPALLRRWENAPNALCRAIITAAVDAVRLGVQAPLSADLLRDAVVDDLTSRERARAVPEAWDAALTYTTTELDGAASVLEPIGTGLGVTDGYDVADFLAEYIGRTRAAVVPPVSAWESYCRHVTTGADLFALGFAAEQRMLLRYAERLYRASDTAESWLALGFMLFRQDRSDEALEAWRNSLARDCTNLHHLVEELDAMGWPIFADAVLRFACTDGQQDAVSMWAVRLDEQGAAEEAERLLREAADADLPGARIAYAVRHWRSRPDEAEQVWRKLLRDGDRGARYSLAWLLTELGRLDEVEQLWRDAIAQGDPKARSELADLLMEQDRHAELEPLWRAGITAGEPDAWSGLVEHFREYDQPAKAERAWREAEAAGQPMNRSDLASLLIDQHRFSEAETLVRDLVETGDMRAHELVEVLELQGKADDVEEVWRGRLAAGDRDAARSLADLLVKQGRTDEVELLWREQIDHHGVNVEPLMTLLADQGRDDEIEVILRQRAAAGDRGARAHLIRRLGKQSRLDDAEQLYREAVDAGHEEHMTLGHFLKRHGRLQEAEDAFRLAVATGEDAAWWGLITVVTEALRFDEADRLQHYGLNPDGSLASPHTGCRPPDEAEPRVRP